jgi:hypothetical protein
MSIKDLDTSENKDGDSNAAKHQEESQDLTSGKIKLPGETDIKNAHATGDGSYGRNDESLPEEDAGDGKVESVY